ncbi:MAG: threonylcarbamoyl-AMP synthase [Chloroflexota bacterium]|nr:MAG: threonylcarbamoyl-AMP synthase [Chloroflexota bacterium]
MRTRVIAVDPLAPDPAVIRTAGRLIRRGRLVAFPTETVYGLGANARGERACARVFEAKGRPAEDPLIVHIASVEAMAEVGREIPDVAWLLATRFWPGPLTLVIKRSGRIPRGVSAGGDTVAVRLPAHPVARALIEAAGCPIAAPSANRFGHVSPTRADHVRADLDGRIDLILDGGPSPLGVESTVLDLTGPSPVVLRPGAVSIDQLREIVGCVTVATPSRQHAHSPGTATRHYAPRARLEAFDGPGARDVAMARVRALLTEGHRVGVLADDEFVADAPAAAIGTSLGQRNDSAAAARLLYGAMRHLDSLAVDVIVTVLPRDEGLGRAIRDRLNRAAEGRVIHVPALAAAGQERTPALG